VACYRVNVAVWGLDVGSSHSGAEHRGAVVVPETVLGGEVKDCNRDEQADGYC